MLRLRVKKSAHLPGSNDPMSERPSTCAPPRVAISNASRAVIHSFSLNGSEVESSVIGPSGGHSPILSLASNRVSRTSTSILEASLLAEPSTPTPTFTPCSRYFLTGAMPEASRMFDDGQWHTPVPLRAKRPISSSLTWTACAYHTSSAIQPSVSRYATGRI